MKTLKKSRLILISSFVLLSWSSCSSDCEHVCQEKIDSLTTIIVEYQKLDKEKNELFVEFNEKLDEYGNIQDSIKIRESEIQQLQQKIQQNKGKATYLEKKRIKQMLLEIDGFLEQNKELITEFDSTDYKAANQQEIVRILLTNIKSKQDQINQLKRDMKKLKIEVEIVTEENENLKKKTDSLEQINTEVITKAAQLTLNNFNITVPENVVGQPKKAKNIDKLDICFAFNENEFVTVGTRTVYFRIIKPDGNLIYKSKSDLFTFKNNQIGYSIAKQVDYQGKKRRYCIEWIPNTILKSGNYKITLFVDGLELQTKHVILR